MSAQLKWRQRDEWCLESDRGGYKVTKFLIDGDPVYQAFKGDVSLLVAGDSKLCRAACAADCEGEGNA